MGRALVISPFIPSRFSSRASKLAYDTCHLMVELGYEQVLLHLPVEAHRQRRRQDVDVQELKACGVIGNLEMYADDLQTSQSEMGALHSIDACYSSNVAMFLTSYLRRHYFDAVVIHAVWLSKYFDVFPLSTIKILATHDQVSQRAAQPTGPHLVTVEGGFVENYVCSEKDTIISLDRAQLIITHNSNYTQWIRRQSKCVDVINFPGRLSERSFTPASIDYRSRNKVVFGFVGDSRLVGFKCLNEFLSLLKKRLLRDPIPIEVLITGEICSHIDTKNFGFVRLVFSETNPQEFWQSIDFIVSLNERAPELDLSVVTAIDVQIPVLSTVHSVVGCALPDDLLVNSLPLLVDRVVDITIQRPDYSRFLELIALSKRNTFALYRDSTQDLSNAIIKKTNSFVLDYPELSLPRNHPLFAAAIATVRLFSGQGRVTLLVEKQNHLTTSQIVSTLPANVECCVYEYAVEKNVTVYIEEISTQLATVVAHAVFITTRRHLRSKIAWQEYFDERISITNSAEYSLVNLREDIRLPLPLFSDDRQFESYIERPPTPSATEFSTLLVRLHKKKALVFDKYLRNFYPNIILISYANDQELIEILPSLLAARNFKKVVYIKQSLSSIENCLAEYLKLFEFIILPFVNIKSLHQLQKTGEPINNTHHARPLLTSMAISQMSRIKDNPTSLLERIEIPSETLLPAVASFHLSQYAKRFIDPEFVLPDHHEINFQSKVELQEVISQESQKISIIISEIAEPCDLIKLLDCFLMQSCSLDQFEIIFLLKIEIATDFDQIFIDYSKQLTLYQVLQFPEDDCQDVRNIAAGTAQYETLIFINCTVTIAGGFIEHCLSLYSGDSKNTYFKPSKISMPPTAAEETAICGDSLAPYYSVDSDLLITTKTIFIRSGGFRLSITDKKTKDILLGYQLWSLGQGLKFVSDSTLNLMKQAIKIHTNKSISVSSDEEVNKLIDYYIPSITQRYKKLLSHHFEFDRHRIPLFSIYIPVYNTEKYLEKCIASVLCQSIQDYEIVIVNDGSTDNTARILERFRENPKIHLFQQSNGGIGSASNLAIRNSRGEYIVQLDSDDCLLPNALEEVAKFFFQKPSSHCLFTKSELINELGEVIGPAWCHGAFNIYDNLVGMTVSHLRTFRRAMYHRTTGFNEEITNAVDYDFFLQLSAQCSIDFLDKVLYQYRKHKVQTSFRQSTLQKINHVKVVNMHLQRVGRFDFYAVAANPFSPRQCYILKKGSDFENKIIHTKFRHGELAELLLPEPRAKGNDYSAMQNFVNNFYQQKVNKNYTEKVSIVVPVYNRAERLSRCLAGLYKQTYPADLIEVVVADDGSSDEVLLIIDKYKKLLNLKYVKQNDSGYRLSAVRNLGIRTATYRNISIIDCDLIPLPNFIEVFMQYLHHFDNVVLLGHQKFVDPTDVSDDDILSDVNILEQLKEIKSENATLSVDALGITKDWRYQLYLETNYLKDDQFPYRAFSSGHVAFRKKAIQDAGFYDESFTVWGGEDNECGYRLYLNGVYFIPVLEAIDLHQEPPSGKNETNRLVDREISRDLLQSKVPTTRGWFGKPYVLTENDKPLISIGIPMRNTGHFVIDAIRSVLAQSIQSLEILVYDDGSSDNTLALVENTFGFNPKIIIIKGFIQKGVTHARNAIIEQCRGEFIGFVDSDDLLMPKCLEECIKVFRSNSKVGLVCTSYNTISEEGVFLSAGYVPEQFNRHTALLGNIFTHFRMFRMRDWNRSRKWTADEIEDLLYAEDWDLCLKIAEVTDFEHIIKPLYCYRIRSGSITTSTNFNFKFNQTKKMLLNWIKYLHLPFSDIVGVDDSNPHAIGYIRQD